MSLRSFYVIVGVLCCCLLQTQVESSPPSMNIRRLYESASESRGNKDDMSFPQPDEDVIELEQLKEKVLQNPEHVSVDSAEDMVNQQDILPALQKQLESETTKSAINLGQPEEEEPTVVQYRPHHNVPQQSTNQGQLHPPTLPQGHQLSQGQPQLVDTQNTNSEKIPFKSFYGAARLAFGQNPEIVTTHSTTAVSTSSTSTTTTIPSTENLSSTSGTGGQAASSSVPPFADNVKDNVKEAEESVSAELETTRNGDRRSLNSNGPKSPEMLLRHGNAGQYSSFDMAQYVFWTGDEAGVARAVEEFIQEGLMTRENAIKFLRDIRLGIEYLQNSYANRIFPDHMKSSSFHHVEPIQESTPPPPTATTGAAFKRKGFDPEISMASGTISPAVQRALERLPSLFRLQEISNDGNKENNIDYDEMAGRMRLADFLYAEYSLEEVIYQLAKVMFSQSLTHGSEQAQRALQRLTGFLESEGSHGRISPALQKKVLDVLLAALSDTIADHPDIASVARAGLGNSFHEIPQHILKPMKN